MRRLATFETWDDPDNQVVIVHWRERDLVVVFPVQWAAAHGDRACIAHAKGRIREVEGKAGRPLAPGSTLLAFSRHAPQPHLQALAPEVPMRLLV